MNKLEEIKSLIDEYDKRVTEEWKSGAEFPMNALKHLLFERRENIIELIEAVHIHLRCSGDKEGWDLHMEFAEVEDFGSSDRDTARKLASADRKAYNNLVKALKPFTEEQE